MFCCKITRKCSRVNKSRVIIFSRKLDGSVSGRQTRAHLSGSSWRISARILLSFLCISSAWYFRTRETVTREYHELKVQLRFRVSATLVSVEPCQAKLLANSWLQETNPPACYPTNTLRKMNTLYLYAQYLSNCL